MPSMGKNILVAVLLIIIFFVFSLPGCRNISIDELTDSTGEENGKEAEISQAEKAGESTDTPPEKNNEENKEPEDNNIDSEILRGFEDIIENTDSYPGIILEYIEENIEDASSGTADHMIKRFEDIQKKYIDTYTDGLFEMDIQKTLLESGVNEITIDDISDINMDDKTGLLEEVLSGGYKLVQLEGSFYPFIDYSVLKKYDYILSTRFQDYLTIMAAESDNIYLKDAAIVISWQELSERLLRAESFLKAYPEQDTLTLEVSGKYLDYLDSYIYGKINTPSYDLNTKMIKDEILQSFNNIVSNNKDTLTADVISKVIKLLQDSDFEFTEGIFKARKDLFKIPIKGYSLDSEYMLTLKAGDIYYQSAYSGSGYIKLTDGSYTEEYEVETSARLKITLSDHLAVGDLNRDGVNDIVLILISSPGGSGTFFDLHFVLNGYSDIYDYSNVFLGDRIQPKNLSVEASKVFLNMIVHDEGDPLCCPTKDVLKSYVIFEDQVAELNSNIGTLQEYDRENISVLVDDLIIDIILKDYPIEFDLESGELIYVEYITDNIDGANMLYYIEPAIR